MAYNKHTWTTQELITSDKLNNIENGIQDSLDNTNADVEVDVVHNDILNDEFYGAYGSPFKDYDKNNILTLANKLNKDNLNIGYITDNHYQPGYAPNSLTHYSHIETLSRIKALDTIILGGDNINGDVSKDNLNLYTDLISSFSFGSTQSDVFMLKGNHDKGIGQSGGLYPDKTLSDSELKTYYKTSEKLYDETRNVNSFYGFKDYEDKKVRVVFLDSFDIPETLTNGLYKYDYLNTSGYQEAQLNWLAWTGLNLPDETWSVIIFTHAPIPGTFTPANTLQYNGDILNNILKAFINRQTLVATNSHTNTDFAVNLSLDFTGFKGKLIGLVSGHVHKDGMVKADGINFIETTCSLLSLSNYPDRQENTDTEDAWDVFSIDNVNKKVDIFRFGAYGSDRNFTY